MNFNNIYNINFSKLANLLTPPFLRRSTSLDWLAVLLSPLSTVNSEFNKHREDSIYKVTHNGQVYSLQAVLNDAYDNELRRIRIVDSLVYDPLYIYPEADLKPVYIYSELENNPVYLYDESVFEEIDVDFLVLIPIEYRPVNSMDLRNLEIQIRSLINYYKIASKKYKIIWTS